MTASSDDSQTTQEGGESTRTAWRQVVRQGLGRLVDSLRESFLPEPHYLEGEEIQQTIRMAPYRANVPTTFAIVSAVLVVIFLIAFLVTRMTISPSDEMIAAGLGLVAVILLVRAGQWRLEYEQWKLIITNMRYIIVTPDPDRQAFADAIYLKDGSIRVLDTNFSKNPLWGLFQITRGTRDVMLSLTPYQFEETGARVKGGLRFPDVRETDIRALEELIFGE